MCATLSTEGPPRRLGHLMRTERVLAKVVDALYWAAQAWTDFPSDAELEAGVDPCFDPREAGLARIYDRIRIRLWIWIADIDTFRMEMPPGRWSAFRRVTKAPRHRVIRLPPLLVGPCLSWKDPTIPVDPAVALAVQPSAGTHGRHTPHRTKQRAKCRSPLPGNGSDPTGGSRRSQVGPGVSCPCACR